MCLVQVREDLKGAGDGLDLALVGSGLTVRTVTPHVFVCSKTDSFNSDLVW